MAKILKFGFITIVVILVILLLVPFLFKDEIFKQIKQEANNNLKGELFIEDLSLSLLRDFPNLSLSLDQVRYEGEAPFEGIELFNIEQIRAELDLMSVISGDIIDIKRITILNPKIDVRILADGTANYLILKDGEETELPETETEESSPFHLTLQHFSISGLDLLYTDNEGDLFTEIKTGNFELKGDFTETEVAVKTTTTISEFTFGSEGERYLNKVEMASNLEAIYNQESGLLTLADNDFQLNNLKLLFSGWLQSFDDKIAMDLQFSAPNSEFREILSLVPVIYMEGYEDVQVAGKFALKGNASGNYFYEGDDLPAFELMIKVEDGNFKYPDLPSAVTDINMNLNISHEQGETDKTIIDISKSSMNIANSPFNANLLLLNPMTDPFIDLNLSTRLDLKKLTEVVPVEGTSLNGLLIAKAKVKGRMSHFETEQYDKVVATGFFSTKKLDVITEELKGEIQIDTAYMEISPQKFNMPILKMKLGQSDFHGSGNLTNMLAYVLADDTLGGTFSLSSTLINATELMNMMPEEESTVVSDSVSVTVGAPSIPGNLNLKIVASATQVIYDDMNLQNLLGTVRLKNSTAYLEGFSMDYLQGKVLMDGNYTASSSGKGMYDIDFELKNLDAKESFSTFNTIQSFAPIASSAQGKFNTKMKFKGTLTDELMPDLNSLSAKGNLTTLGMILQPEIMTKVASLLNNENYKALNLSNADLSFEINDGRVEVKPMMLKMGDLKTEFSGSGGLDQTLDYKLKTEVSIANIDLPAELKALNLAGGKIPVQLNIGGTVTNPTVKPVFGDAESITGFVKDVVNNAVAEVKDSAINTINNEAAKIMEQAKQQADALILEAEKQAAAIKSEAAKQAEALKAETRVQVEKLKTEAGSDPLKQFAAKTAGDKLIKESDKKIEAMNQQANQQADQVVAKAKVEADKILKAAEEKAKIQN